MKTGVEKTEIRREDGRRRKEIGRERTEKRGGKEKNQRKRGQWK